MQKKKKIEKIKKRKKKKPNPEQGMEGGGGKAVGNAWKHFLFITA